MANSRAYGLLTERQYVVASLSSNGDILDGFTRMSPLRFMKLRVTPSSCQLTSLGTSSAGFSVQSSFLSAFTITAALPLHFALTGTTLSYLLCPWNDSYFLVYFSPIPEGLPRVYDNMRIRLCILFKDLADSLLLTSIQTCPDLRGMSR